VNGTAIQIRRLRPGDQVSIGRIMLLFGTMEEIAERRKAVVPASNVGGQVQTVRADELQARSGSVSVTDSQRTVAPAPPPATGWTAFDDDVPPLPQKLSPAQAARLAEILDYLHKGLT